MVAAAIVLTLIVRPSVARGDMRALDLALAACLAAIALQLLPLPPAVRLALSPASRGVDLRLRIDAPVSAFADAPHPLTVDSSATMQSLWLAVSVVLAFWCARALFGRGGIRVGARAIALFGLAAAAFGIAQHATAPHSLYWLRPFKYTEPFGPYLNRSDFAMWMVMSLPLTAGYLLTRMYSRQRRGGRLFTTEGFDDTALFLVVALGLMAAALMVALSRSGLIGAAVAALSAWSLAEQRVHRKRRAWLLAGVGALAVVVLFFANASALAARVDDTLERGMGPRLDIWRATLPMIRDFWRTGVGTGAYERAMIVYQPAPHETYFNHAHNEYLQLLSEGGLLFAIPGALVVVAAVVAIRRRLAFDRTPIYWIRVGAVSGMAGVAVQSLWETGLRRPANTVLFAIVAAFALHSAPQPARRSGDDSTSVSQRE
ncbi:MAG TPA: O-antigen ligase family protein [Vicinamibacterales bacterium]|nr:O-antigen ligase family protein [Vicinamibacterales bacterium]